MKNITIITEAVSERALVAAVPTNGVASVTVSENRSARRDADPTPTYRSFRNPNHFKANVRIELVVDDDAVESVFDAVDFAYGAGVFSDAEMWVGGPALALSA